MRPFKRQEPLFILEDNIISIRLILIWPILLLLLWSSSVHIQPQPPFVSCLPSLAFCSDVLQVAVDPESLLWSAIGLFDGKKPIQVNFLLLIMLEVQQQVLILEDCLHVSLMKSKNITKSKKRYVHPLLLHPPGGSNCFPAPSSLPRGTLFPAGRFGTDTFLGSIRAQRSY